MPYKSMKKPVTPYNGGLKDQYTDNMDDFPWGTEEDMCDKCLEDIKGSNSDTNKNCVTYGTKITTGGSIADIVGYKPLSNAEIVDRDYQGWGESLKLYND